MELALILSAIFLIFLGIIIRIFKLSFLIAGYNTASKKEKEKYNENALIKAISNLLIFSSLILILGYILSLFFRSAAELIQILTWIAYVIYILFALVHINTSSKIKKIK